MVDAKPVLSEAEGRRFEAVSSRVSFPDLEQSVLERWRAIDAFNRVAEVRKGAPLFVFYEGPPTANGAPGIHHVITRAYKDVMIRYKTMRGFMPLRRGGWDTHGLAVELEVEKELGLKNKQDIEAYGIEEFNQRCRESVFRYISEWEQLTERSGSWLDMNDAYITYDNGYIENGWWVFKRLWDQGLVYEGFRVTPHCPRCVTSLSSHEVAQGYKDDTPDPSIFVRMPLSLSQPDAEPGVAARLGLDNSGVPPMSKEAIRKFTDPPSLAIWTTTPWTLTANMAVAVAPGQEYVLVRAPEGAERDERLVLAASLMESTLGEGWRVLERFAGSDLVGLRYEAPYPLVKPEPGMYRVYAADYVTTQDGTGLVHTAPAYGADDAELGREHGLPTQHTVDLHGVLADGFPGAGKFVKEADGEIIRDLDRRSLLLKQGIYRHTYPFCWRCDTPLLYYAKASWYIQTTAAKERLMEGNQSINWHPDHVREGRFGEWLRNNVDWAVSRERYWGTPIPIWRCETCGETACVGSKAELAALATPQTRALVEGLDLHRPYVDRIKLVCKGCGEAMARVPEVADAWYDSGAMPFAQWNFPVTLPTPNGEVTLRSVEDVIASPYYPADYITEGIDQTRGWFYSLLAESVLLTNQPSYRNVIVLGLILDEKGEKMSKSKGNAVDPWEVMGAQGADALRWYLYTAAPAGVARRFSQGLVQESLRRFMLTLWNTYSFFVTYANIDGFVPEEHAARWKGEVGGPVLAGPPANELDRWIVSELNGLVSAASSEMDGYNPTDAGRRIEEFVNRLSNWYVRRSRRRFWKSENDEDKASAYVTLYSCLLTVSRLIAPMTPFVADAMYANLASRDSVDSVHLADWPMADATLTDETLERATRLAMRIASLGRAARSQSAIKVRQPLARVLVQTRDDDVALLPSIRSQVIDELNVKALEVAADDGLATISVRPNLPLLGPKYGRLVGAIRAAIDQANAADLASSARAGDLVRVGEFTLEPEELLIDMEERDGFAIASEEGGSLVVAIDTALTPELKAEGFARELVHRFQNLRRDAGFDIADRIVTYVGGADETTRAVLATHESYLRDETLSDKVVLAAPPERAYGEAQDVEGISLALGVERTG